MNIPFTREQFQVLLRMTYIAEWVANTGRNDTESADIARLTQHIYAHAAAFGVQDLLEHREGELHPAPALDTAMLPIIDAYEEEGFWDRLIEMLAARDLAMEHGEEGVEKLPREEYIEHVDERASVYEEEFEEYGVDRLFIVEE
jgi:hypothetical protein